MALRRRCYLSQVTPDPTGRLLPWVHRNAKGLCSSSRSPSQQMAIVMVCGEAPDLDALEALPDFAGRARPLRYGVDPLYTTIDSPAVRRLLQHWNIDGAMISSAARVSDVILMLLLVGNNRATLQNWLVAEMQNEQGVD